MKTFLWLISVAAACAGGFYLGIGYGAQSIGTIAAQTQVVEGLSRVRSSLNALEANDIAHSQELMEQNLKSALFQIGSNLHDLEHWACSETDRETIQAANQYAQKNPELVAGPWQTVMVKGLELCVDGVRTQSGGA